MKKSYYYSLAALLAAVAFIGAAGCNPNHNSDTLIGNWKKADDFEGLARSEAVSFTINGKAYICSGLTNYNRQQDCWEYDPNNRFWTQKSDLPGIARSAAVAFVIGNKGYVATGSDGENQLKDLWEYDPQADTWTRKADMPTGGRSEAVGFGLNSKGYIACGNDGNYLRDCWEYTPGSGPSDSGSWAHKASVGGSKRSQAIAFVVNNTAYIMGGSNNGDIQQDIWVFDPIANTWTEKAKLYNFSSEPFDDQYVNITRENGVAIVIGDKVYIATGDNVAMNTSTWEYTAATDRWRQKTGFEATSRTGACAMSINNRGFVLTGRNSTLVMDNAVEFQPDAPKIDND